MNWIQFKIFRVLTWPVWVDVDFPRRSRVLNVDAAAARIHDPLEFAEISKTALLTVSSPLISSGDFWDCPPLDSLKHYGRNVCKAYFFITVQCTALPKWLNALKMSWLSGILVRHLNKTRVDHNKWHETWKASYLTLIACKNRFFFYSGNETRFCQ